MPGFTLDFLYGFFAATLLWLVVKIFWDMYRGYIKQIKAPKNPQSTSQKTSKTPAQIVAEANRAKFRLFLWFLLLAFVLFVAWEWYVAGTSASITNLFQ